MRRALAAALVLLAALAAGTARAQVPPRFFVEDLTWVEVRAAIAGGATTALIYAGSTEQNGPHMATGKHNRVARYVAGRVAQALGNALVYPVIPFAPTGDAQAKSGHMRFPGSVSVSEATYAAVVRDVAQSAVAAGFRNVALLGDHGGGQEVLGRVATELDGKGAHVFHVPDAYFRTEQRATEFLKARGLDPGLHAGVLDTAELMFVDPASVRSPLEAGDGKNGVEGDPRGATAELGRALVQLKIDSAVEQIKRLAK